MECIVNILFTIYVFLNVINWIQISLIKNENVMTFKALRLLIFGVGISIEIVLFLIWKLNNFMVSYHFFENIFIYFKLVVAQSAFFSNNSGYELSMISSKYWFIKDLLGIYHQVCVDKLRHFNVIIENIKRQFSSFSYCDELFIFIVNSIFIAKINSIFINFAWFGAILESSDWRNHIFKSIVKHIFFNSQSSALFIVVFAHVKWLAWWKIKL
jgi:hypothetical protein